jgi:hypothetical protein
MSRLNVFLTLAGVYLLAACSVFEPLPTAIPTRQLTGPTTVPSPVFRGELPTEGPQFTGQNDPTAAAMPSGGDLPPLPVGSTSAGGVQQGIAITGSDGHILTGDLYAGGGGLRVPGLLMLAPDSAEWLDIPLRLQAAGFTVLTMSTDEVVSTGDVSAALQSLKDFNTVDPGRMGVIGAQNGADLALLSCSVELLCDVVALISPTQHDPLLIAMQRYNPRSIFVAAGESDSTGIAAARSLEDYAQGPARLETAPGAQRGALLIQANPNIGDRLIEWLQGQFAL